VILSITTLAMYRKTFNKSLRLPLEHPTYYFRLYNTKHIASYNITFCLRWQQRQLRYCRILW